MLDASEGDRETSRGPSDRDPKARRWLRRVGVAGFVFFLAKGLLWLLVPAIYVLWVSSEPEQHRTETPERQNQ